jgi:integrase
VLGGRGAGTNERRASGHTLLRLRHTCATLLLTRGVHPKIVSEMLGHSSVSITLDVYSHVIPGLGDAAALAIEDALS